MTLHRSSDKTLRSVWSYSLLLHFSSVWQHRWRHSFGVVARIWSPFGSLFERIIRVAMELMRQGAMLTVLSILLAALAWLATLLVATEFIDNKWLIPVGVILGGIPQILKALEIISSQIRYGAGKTHPAKDKLERHLADAQMFDMAWMVTHNGGAAIKYDTKFVRAGAEMVLLSLLVIMLLL
ncbi:hypothetical protein IFM89_010491 [Coptis chinensis]|uniref:Uncharacterized protein n=1 Tax=Coptis chinensis TaxID=261450 RepID=A0A835GXS0_9MAGN|nr:hypothetical protein IFM89_010491 [Coptis chinensis]